MRSSTKELIIRRLRPFLASTTKLGFDETTEFLLKLSPEERSGLWKLMHCVRTSHARSQFKGRSRGPRIRVRSVDLTRGPAGEVDAFAQRASPSFGNDTFTGARRLASRQRSNR